MSRVLIECYEGHLHLTSESTLPENRYVSGDLDKEIATEEYKYKYRIHEQPLVRCPIQPTDTYDADNRIRILESKVHVQQKRFDEISKKFSKVSVDINKPNQRIDTIDARIQSMMEIIEQQGSMLSSAFELINKLNTGIRAEPQQHIIVDKQHLNTPPKNTRVQWATDLENVVTRTPISSLPAVEYQVYTEDDFDMPAYAPGTFSTPMSHSYLTDIYTVADIECIQNRGSVDPAVVQIKEMEEAKENGNIYLPYLCYPFAPHYWFRYAVNFGLRLHTPSDNFSDVDVIYDPRLPYSVSSHRLTEYGIFRKLRHRYTTVIPYLEKRSFSASNGITYRATRIPDKKEAKPNYEMVINCIVSRDLSSKPYLVLGRNFGMQNIFQIQMAQRRIQMVKNAEPESIPFDVYKPAETFMNTIRDEYEGWENVFNKRCGETYAPRPKIQEKVELPMGCNDLLFQLRAPQPR